MIRKLREVLDEQMNFIHVQHRKGTITEHELHQATICRDKINTALNEFESNLHIVEMLCKLERGEKL